MALTADQRKTVRATFMRERLGSSCAATKAEILQSVDAIDDWLDTQATVINLLFPLLVRSKLTAPQKAWLFAYVALRRASG